MSLLAYRAGPRALERLRREGLVPGSIRAVVGPASGPRWLALVGLDRALMGSGLLAPSPGPDPRRIQLAGASAGAWRMLAFACSDPRGAHQRLLDGYIEQVFDRSHTPADISRAYEDLLANVVGGDVEHVLDHPVFDLAIHTARCRAGGHRVALAAAMLAAGLLNFVTARATDVFFERVLFTRRPSALPQSFGGRLVPLQPDNLLAAARASGTVPFYLEAVRDPSAAPRGAYVDGGLNDYHLRARYLDEKEDGLVLFPHFRRRILPRWLDRFRTGRQPSPAAMANVLQIYPSAEFVASLPDGRLPDREDFTRFISDPQERIRRWHLVVSASEALGEQLLEDLESGRWVEVVQPLNRPH